METLRLVLLFLHLVGMASLLGGFLTQLRVSPRRVVPAMVPHALRNVGDETVRVVGFFSSNVVASVFDRPMMPFGQREVGTPPLLQETEQS